MSDTVIKVASTAVIPVGVVTNSHAAIDIPEDGVLEAVSALIHATVAGAETPAVGTEIAYILSAELSFLSTNQFNINDARGSIAEVHVSYHVSADGTAGGPGSSKMSESSFLTLGKGLTVNAGERIHAHCSSNSATLTGRFVFVLYLSTKGGGRRSGRRR